MSSSLQRLNRTGVPRPRRLVGGRSSSSGRSLPTGDAAGPKAPRSVRLVDARNVARLRAHTARSRTHDRCQKRFPNLLNLACIMRSSVALRSVCPRKVERVLATDPPADQAGRTGVPLILQLQKRKVRWHVVVPYRGSGEEAVRALCTSDAGLSQLLHRCPCMAQLHAKRPFRF